MTKIGKRPFCPVVFVQSLMPSIPRRSPSSKPSKFALFLTAWWCTMFVPWPLPMLRWSPYCKNSSFWRGRTRCSCSSCSRKQWSRGLQNKSLDPCVQGEEAGIGAPWTPCGGELGEAVGEARARVLHSGVWTAFHVPSISRASVTWPSDPHQGLAIRNKMQTLTHTVPLSGIVQWRSAEKPSWLVSQPRRGEDTSYSVIRYKLKHKVVLYSILSQCTHRYFNQMFFESYLVKCTYGWITKWSILLTCSRAGLAGSHCTCCRLFLSGTVLCHATVQCLQHFSFSVVFASSLFEYDLFL